MKKILLPALLLSFLSVNAQYHVYDSPNNQISQTIIQTSDGGLFLASLQFCYTPDEWVIEGCPVGIQMVKTNAQGDTIWISETVNYHVQGNIHAFENSDGSYTVMASQNATYQCNEWVIDPLFGLYQVLVYHIGSDGGIISERAFPDNCHLFLLDALQLSDSTYVAVANYAEIFDSEYVEGRLLKLNEEGVILDSVSMPWQDFYKGNITTYRDSQILLLYLDTTGVLQLDIYDDNLELLQSYENVTVDASCLIAKDGRVSMEVLANENIFVMCDKPFAKGQNVELYSFDNTLATISHDKYTIPFSADFTETVDHHIAVVSEHRFGEDSTDMKVTYFTTQGDSLDSEIIRIPGNQTPYQINSFNDSPLLIVGSHNCCNRSANVGPGLSYLFLDQSTAVDDVSDKNEIHFYPNPASEEINILWDKDYVIPPLQLSIYTATGVHVQDYFVNENSSIDLRNISAGMYVMMVRENGKVIGREVLVKLE